MFRLLQDTLSGLVSEENSAMAHKGRDSIDTNSFKVLNDEPTLSDTVAQLKLQIVEQEKEMFDVKKVNKKLEKRNKNLKESIEKLIEEKRQIEELSKVIEEQKETIGKYEEEMKEIKDHEKELVTAVNEKRSTSPQAYKSKNTDPQFLQKQIDLLSSKNLEMKSEIDRRTRISDQMKREHETALKDRNELLSEVKILKQQVDDMRHRLDRSLALLVRKKKGIKDPEDVSIGNPSITLNESTTISTKGTQTLRDKIPTKVQMNNQNRKSAGGRLILNSVGRSYQTTNSKKNRGTGSQKDVRKDSTPEVSPMKIVKEESSKIHKENIENEKSLATSLVSSLAPSQSIQEVKGKRVVSDIRNKLEKQRIDKDYMLEIDVYTTPTDSQDMTNNNGGKNEDIMELFEVVDEGDSCTRKV